MFSTVEVRFASQFSVLLLLSVLLAATATASIVAMSAADACGGRNDTPLQTSTGTAPSSAG